MSATTVDIVINENIVESTGNVGNKYNASFNEAKDL